MWLNLFTNDRKDRAAQLQAHNEAIDAMVARTRAQYEKAQREKKELMDKIDRILNAVEK